MRQLPQDEIKELADYLQGFTDSLNNPRMAKAADWLIKASENICAGGYFGCSGGRECSSDHK